MNGVTCDRCGVGRSLRPIVRVGIAFERRLTVERDLCRSCAERALAAMGEALAEKGETWSP